MQAYHTLIVGDSGGGKTTLAREYHDEFNGLSVWINHNNVDGIDGNSINNAYTVRSVNEAKRSDATRLNWITDDPLATARKCREVAHDYRQKTGYPVQVIFDEFQEVLPDGNVEPDNPAKRMLHEDRDMGVKVVGITQDPSDLEYTPVKQFKWYVWCGEWSTFHDGFIRYFSIPRDELPTEPYQYVTFDKRMNVQYRGKTKERYAV